LLADYLMLGLEPEASEEQIRKCYLALVKAHPPEHDPQRFQDIAKAYERIKDRHARIRHQLFGCRPAGDVEESLDYLVRAARPQRRRAGLQELLKTFNITED
jgi:DnaJ-class molecular chaperone